MNSKESHCINSLGTSMVFSRTLLLSVVFSFSCSSNQEEATTSLSKEFERQGEQIHCIETKLGKTIRDYYMDSDSTLHGTYLSYYDNGNIKEKGSYYNGEKGNYWHYFSESGTLKESEYYTMDFNSPERDLVLAEHIDFNGSGDTVYENSYFFEIKPSQGTYAFSSQPLAYTIRLRTPEKSAINGYLKIIREQDVYDSFEADFYEGSEHSIVLTLNRVLSPGKYVVAGVINDYDTVIAGNDTAFETIETNFSRPVVIVR